MISADTDENAYIKKEGVRQGVMRIGEVVESFYAIPGYG